VRQGEEIGGFVMKMLGEAKSEETNGSDGSTGGERGMRDVRRCKTGDLWVPMV
jgi:hypothetical protein